MAKIYKNVGIKDGKVGYLVSGSITYVDIPYTNGFTMSSSTTEITFEGDNTSEKVFSDSELSGTVRFDKMSIDLLQDIYSGKVQLTAAGSDQTVASVTGLVGGSGYTVAPTVTFTGGGGTGATAHATVASGVVTAVVIDTPGHNYTSVPTVVFTGVGTGASATAVLGTFSAPSGVATRLYMGDNTEFAQVPVELVMTIASIEENAGVSSAKDMVITVPKANLSPFKPGDLGNRAKESFEIQWTAVKTTKDIAGNALPSVPADGCTWYVDVLS